MGIIYYIVTKLFIHSIRKKKKKKPLNIALEEPYKFHDIIMFVPLYVQKLPKKRKGNLINRRRNIKKYHLLYTRLFGEIQSTDPGYSE